MALRLVTPPQTEPITLQVVKEQLRIDESDTSSDSIISSLIAPAREWCESFQNRAYVAQTFELVLDSWPKKDHICIPRPPLQLIESVKYIDYQGVESILTSANYVVDYYSEPARLVKHSHTHWPSVRLAPANGVVVRFTAGWSQTAAIPAKIKQAIILLVVWWYENGVCEPPQAVKSLLWPDRILPVGVL